MAGERLPVPPGFVLPTAWCREYLRDRSALGNALGPYLEQGLRHLEESTGLGFGGDRRPLLVSVRSGAPVSMPGMMSTLLNVGLCDRTVRAMIRMTGNPRHAWDSYRRLIEQYAEVVRGTSPDPFESALADVLARSGTPSAAELDGETLRGLARTFEELYRSRAGEAFPQDPRAQLRAATEAVFESWRSPRAIEFRRQQRIDETLGTAVTVQAMVFGNMGGLSGSGVAFTRDPASGANGLYLDFAWNGQGEDVVSGRVALQEAGRLLGRMPELYGEIQEMARRLEEIFRDVQDFEFTLQEGRLYLLQTRDAKRTPWAALRIALDLVREGRITKAEALDRLRGIEPEKVERRKLIPKDGSFLLCRGIPASPGAAVGELAFDSESAVAMAEAGRTPILVRPDIATADLAGMNAAAGIVTTRGGRTSHGAVVARHLNKVCIVNCRDLVVSQNRVEGHAGGRKISRGQVLSLDGTSGEVYTGRVEVSVERPLDESRTLRSWREELRERASVP
jgi:pyruvate,orthophosphate dikinase